VHADLLIIVAILAFFTAVLWFVASPYRARLRANWILLAASFALHLAPQRAHWLEDIALALAELVAVRLVALVVFRLILHRAGWPVILTDVAIVGGYALVLISFLVHVGVNVSGLLATSALLAGILGLAMQEVLGNLVGGVAIHADGEIQEGVWIKSEHGAGCVTHVRLRHTSIKTADNNTVVIPNSALTKAPVTIISGLQRLPVRFRLSAQHRPTTIIRVVEEALASSALPNIAKEPAPRCCISEFESQHIEYLVHVWATSPGHEHETASAVLNRIYFALERAGAPVASVPTSLEVTRGRVERYGRSPDDAIDLLRAIPLWSSLTETEIQTMAGRLKWIVFGPGEPIVRQSEAGSSMFILLRGRVAVSLDAAGRREQVAMLEPGGFFGEMSLMTGERRSATVTAIDEVECLELQKDDVADLLRQRPELARDISLVLETRQRELGELRAKSEMSAQPARGPDLMTRIQQFFGIERKAAGVTGPPS
jgi:small-conductance mechanosensitive channel/CRP-like cAMP-binding protein